VSSEPQKKNSDNPVNEYYSISREEAVLPEDEPSGSTDLLDKAAIAADEPAAVETPAETNHAGGSSAAELFEERQRQYLRGRKSTKNITDNHGMIIVREGEIINDQVIDRVKKCGKLVELVMNNEV